MLRLIPAPLHRALLQPAQAAKAFWARRFKPQFTGCSVVALDSRGHVLLVRQTYGSTAWCLPGGGIGRGEDPEAAARREMFEELACRLDGLKFVGAFDESFHGAPNRVHLFTGNVLSEPRPDEREIAECRFFPSHSLPHPLDSSVVHRIAAAREHL